MSFQMRKYPLSNFTQPKNGAHIIHCDYWWPVTVDDEIFFYGSKASPFHSPQCNSNKLVVERFADNTYIKAAGGFYEIRQITVVYVPINWSDYDH